MIQKLLCCLINLNLNKRWNSYAYSSSEFKSNRQTANKNELALSFQYYHSGLYTWKSRIYTVFRNRSSLAIICHFNEKYMGCVWCVDDILEPKDKSPTSTVTLLKTAACCINSNRSGYESIYGALLSSHCSLKWFSNPSVSAYAMSGVKQPGQRGDGTGTKQSQKVKRWQRNRWSFVL